MISHFIRSGLFGTLAFAASASVVGAAAVPVVNGNFEADAIARAGDGQNNGTPTGWTAEGVVFGTFTPANMGAYSGRPAGFDAVHGSLLSFAQGGATLSQVVPGALFQADTAYTLTVLAGDSYEGVGGNYTISLSDGTAPGGEVYATFTDAFPAAAYTTTNAVASFSTQSLTAAVGKPIQVSIFAADGASKTFDNVTLDASPVPEPGALSMLALGGIAALRRRRGNGARA